MSDIKNFILCSKSELKRSAIDKVLCEEHDNFSLEIEKGKSTETPQPFGIDNTISCGKSRLIDYEDNSKIQISVENGIIYNEYGFIMDICYVAMGDENGTLYDNSETIMDTAIYVPNGVTAHKVLKKKGSTSNGKGYKSTIGEYLAKRHCVPKDNWMKHLCNQPREEQIEKAFKCALNKWKAAQK